MEIYLEPWYFGECMNCKRILRKSNFPRNTISVVHKGYGLCPKCYWVARKNEETPYRPLINRSSPTLECSKCQRILPLAEMKISHQKPTRTCKVCSKLIERYKITYLEYIRLLDESGYQCSICKDSVKGVTEYGKAKAVVDHDHGTGNVRGILCSTCNLGLGQLKRSINPDKVQEYLDNRIEVPKHKCYCAKCRVRREATGLSCVQIDYLCDLFGNKCYLCSEVFEGAPFVDHDHTCCGPKRRYTCFSCIRGVLCRGCNSMIGMFGESSLRISRALKYLGDRH